MKGELRLMYYVYILYSRNFDRFYIGQSNDVPDRLERHNAGRETSTKHYLPWELYCVIEKTSRGDAVRLEKKLKNLSKVRLRAFVEKYKM